MPSFFKIQQLHITSAPSQGGDVILQSLFTSYRLVFFYTQKKQLIS